MLQRSPQTMREARVSAEPSQHASMVPTPLARNDYLRCTLLLLSKASIGLTEGCGSHRSPG